jgi:hypothetical protein
MKTLDRERKEVFLQHQVFMRFGWFVPSKKKKKIVSRRSVRD